MACLGQPEETIRLEMIRASGIARPSVFARVPFSQTTDGVTRAR
jgi:hypothetical protein